MSQSDPDPVVQEVEEAKSGAPSPDLQKRLFHLTTLYEANQELGVLTTTESILEAFLPLCMGPLGSASGFIIVREVESARECHLAMRGLDAIFTKALCETAGHLTARIFQQTDPNSAPEQPVVFRGKHLASEPLLPPETQILVAFPVGGGTQGLLGLGPRIDGVPYDPDDQDLMLGLVRNCTVLIQRTTAQEKIRLMNERLEAQNIELRRSLDEMALAKGQLDRRALQLKHLYDTSMELSGLLEPQPILETFLLLVLGAFSVRNGFLVVYDTNQAAPELAVRGLAPETEARLGESRTRTAVLGLFVALKDRIPQIMESRWVVDPIHLRDIPGDPTAVVVFTVDEVCRGALGLGPRLTDEKFTTEDHRIMSMLLSQFMVSLDNARHFETAQRLNQDLERRNQELERTLRDLTSARTEIDLLQTAKERILGLVKRERERLDRATVLDFILIGVVSVAMGLLFNMASPSRIPLFPPSLTEKSPPSIAMDQAMALHKNQSAVFIDARPPQFFKQGRIATAVNLPLSLFDFVYDMKLSELDPEHPLVVYGRTISQHYDAEVALKLMDMGHAQVSLLEGGLPAWGKAGYPLEP